MCCGSMKSICANTRYSTSAAWSLPPTTKPNLPAEDRRHYVAWSDLTKEDFTQAYWDEIWGWYENDGGIGHVVAYLQELDIADFNPKAPPPKTEAFWAI